MSYSTSDPVSVLTFLTPAELTQVSKFGSTLADLKKVDEFQWGECDLSPASLDRLTHALSNLTTPAPVQASIELTPMGSPNPLYGDAPIFADVSHAEPVYTGYKPPRFHLHVGALWKPSGHCVLFWLGFWALLGLLLFIPFMIPAATTTVSQANFGLLDFNKYDCVVRDQRWVPTKYGGYWTYMLSVPGENFQFWDRLVSISTWAWTAETNLATITVPCWYGKSSQTSYQRGLIYHPHVEQVRLSESAWTLWTWSLGSIAATLAACLIMCTVKRRRLEDYDMDVFCKSTGYWGIYLGWFTLIVSGITCFWFAVGCHELETYADKNGIVPVEGYWATTGADSNNYVISPVCGVGGFGAGTVGLWVVGGLFLAGGVLGGAASIKCIVD